jgi:hypothetical protein
MENPTTTEHDVDRNVQQSRRLKTRHASAIAKLMAEREDLQGTYAFADLVSESLRWSA